MEPERTLIQVSVCLWSHVPQQYAWNNNYMIFLRTAALVLIAILVPGGLVVLVPTVYRLLIELRNKRQTRARGRLAPANSDVSA